ncbi:hypothetical protein BDN72DRAFT_485139 [Pluteus cervinus]|uniref:Uncharacterized protein n=1 Tax=Pluteus cervinus TaxID=181527 RepID=A0ACD3A593_9AGAR|nr:hypothetical protein BDN72DRAFT_485139 [Pluteus cervinus]
MRGRSPSMVVEVPIVDIGPAQYRRGDTMRSAAEGNKLRVSLLLLSGAIVEEGHMLMGKGRKRKRRYKRNQRTEYIYAGNGRTENEAARLSVVVAGWVGWCLPVGENTMMFVIRGFGGCTR